MTAGWVVPVSKLILDKEHSDYDFCWFSYAIPG
jgi:hypothetical protein